MTTHMHTCRNIVAVVGPPGSGKSALVAAMCGRLYKPAKATGKILITGKEAYESFKPTWFSANDVLTTHLTVHQYLVYKGVLLSGAKHSACTEKGLQQLHHRICACLKELQSSLCYMRIRFSTVRGVCCCTFVDQTHISLLQIVTR